MTVFASKINWAISREKSGDRHRHPPASTLELCQKAQAESCRAAQSGQESWGAALLLAGNGAWKALAAKPNLQGSVSNTEAAREGLKLQLRTKPRSAPALAEPELLLFVPGFVLPLVCSHNTISANSKIISQRCPGCNTAERQRQQFLKMFPALMHKKMLYPIFQELLNSASLLSSVKFSGVSLGQKFQYPHCR